MSTVHRQDIYFENIIPILSISAIGIATWLLRKDQTRYPYMAYLLITLIIVNIIIYNNHYTVNPKYTESDCIADSDIINRTWLNPVIIGCWLIFYNNWIFIKSKTDYTEKLPQYAMVIIIGIILIYYATKQSSLPIYKSLDDVSSAFQIKGITPKFNDGVDAKNDIWFRAIWNYINSDDKMLNKLIQDCVSSDDTQCIKSTKYQQIRNKLLELAYIVVRPVEDNVNYMTTISYQYYKQNFTNTWNSLKYIGILISIILINVYIHQSLVIPVNQPNISFIYILIIIGVLSLFTILISILFKDDPDSEPLEKLIFQFSIGSGELTGYVILYAIIATILLTLIYLFGYYGLGTFIGNHVYGIAIVQFILLTWIFIQKQTAKHVNRTIYTNDGTEKTTTLHGDQTGASGHMVTCIIILTIIGMAFISLIQNRINIQSIQPIISGLTIGAIYFMIFFFPYIIFMFNVGFTLINIFATQTPIQLFEPSVFLNNISLFKLLGIIH